MDVLNDPYRISPAVMASEKTAAARLENKFLETAAGCGLAAAGCGLAPAGRPRRHGTPPTIGKGFPGPPT